MVTLDKRNAVDVLLQVILYRFCVILFTSLSLKSEINISAREGLHLASLSLLFALGSPVVMGNLSVVFGGFVSVKRERGNAFVI